MGNCKFYEQYQKDPSLKLKYVLKLEEVSGFSLIRVHPGVKIGDTRGCPQPGLATDMDKDFNFSVDRSREALKRICRILDPFFVEGVMDFGVEAWWEVRRKSLIETNVSIFNLGRDAIPQMALLAGFRPCIRL